jgi:HIRAN domain
MTPEQLRRAADRVVLPIYLRDDAVTVPVADGEMFGFGFKPYLDSDRTVELLADDSAPVLPGVFFTRVVGVSFHDDVLQMPQFRAGQSIAIKPEPSNPRDRNALAVVGGGLRVGYLPAPIADVLAPSGTRSGRGFIVKEWSTNGVRHDIWILGSMHVTLSVSTDDP